MNETDTLVQLVDRSIAYPRGVVEDVVDEVGKFKFPVDFVVMDMHEDSSIPLILGRPFLATARALIDASGGELTLRVEDESVVFKIPKAQKDIYDDAFVMLDSSDVCVSVNVQELLLDDLFESTLERIEKENGLSKEGRGIG